MRKSMAVDGRNIMIPLRVTTLGIYYNQKIFEEAGLLPFTSYDDFKLACQTIKSKTKYVPLATAGATQGWIFQLWFCIQNVSGTDEQKLYDCQVGYADLPGVKQTWQMWKELMNSGWIPEGYFGMDYEPARALFFQGRAAMSLDGSWMLKDYRKGAEMSGFKYGIMPLPQINPKTPAKDVFNVDAIMAFKGSKHPKEAIEVLKFISTPDTQKYMAETWLNISLTKGVSYTDPDVKTFASFLEGDKAWYGVTGVWSTTPEIGAAESKNWEGVAAGKVSIEEAIKQVQDAMNQYCKK
jgi:ABC-type glycerol-3-phosphate transport system substrate-binding protein